MCSGSFFGSRITEVMSNFSDVSTGTALWRDAFEERYREIGRRPPVRPAPAPETIKIDLRNSSGSDGSPTWMVFAQPPDIAVPANLRRAALPPPPGVSSGRH